MTAQSTKSEAIYAAARLPDKASPRSHRILRMRAYLVLAFIDATMIALGVVGASLIRFGTPLTNQGWVLFGMLLPLFLAMAYNGRAYQSSALAFWRNGVVSLLGALYSAVATIVFVGFCLKASTDYSRLLLWVAVVLWTVLLPIGRAIVGRWTWAQFGGVPINRVLILDGMAIEPPEGVTVLVAADAGLSPTVVEPMLLDRLARAVQDADDVVVACLPEQRPGWAMALKRINIHGEIILPELDALGGVSISRFAGMATMLVSTGPLRIRDRIAKRVLDLTLAIATLILLAPLLAIVSIAVKLDSRGPTLFRQQRIGYKNRLFEVFKFRSMRVDASDHAGGRSASRDDDRITRVGRFIRATSLDELPQLFNILRGEMSFVGPRPHALGSLAGDQLFWEVDARYLDRHACKPGLTGLAQIRGFRGATHRREDLVNRLHADLEYLNGWSVVRDISIMVATVKVVVHRNAF